MTIRVATMDDLMRLIPLRMRYFHEFCQAMSPAEVEETERANRRFLEWHLNSPFSRTWMAEIDRAAVSIGIMVIFIRSRSDDGTVGFEAYLQDVYTSSDFRRQGHATNIVNEAMAYARSQGLKRLWLHSTPTGRTLYHAAGFQYAATAMTLRSA